MPKDVRYKTLKVMIETKNISTFEEVFNVVPKTVVSTDLGINYVRFLARINKPGGFTLEELIRLASFIEVDSKLLIDLILTDMAKKASKKKK